MEEEDWREIVQLIQDELRDIGQDEIADLSNYEVREGSERFPPPARKLAKEMLDALHRDLSVRSSATVRQSLVLLEQLIDVGKPPSEAILWVDRERASVEGRDLHERLNGDESVPEAVEELEQLIGQLTEIGFGGDGR